MGSAGGSVYHGHSGVPAAQGWSPHVLPGLHPVVMLSVRMHVTFALYVFPRNKFS